MGRTSLVRAAGCVLWRRSSSGTIELALVFRPKWSDWSWPKGKINKGETARAAALREVREETGCTCRLGSGLPLSRYIDHKGRQKEVKYWAAESTGGAFAPSNEVSELVWLSPDEARERLTYVRDRDLISAALVAIDADGHRGTDMPEQAQGAEIRAVASGADWVPAELEKTPEPRDEQQEC